MAVGHRTYGGWGGDFSVIKSGGLAHLLIGKEEGQWVQFGPTEALFYHCNGANDGYGLELTGVNEDDFTDWQIRCLRYVVPLLNQEIGVPLVYSDGSDGWVNGHAFVGFHSHNRILTDDGTSQHTNLWKRSDWDKVVAASALPTKEGKMIRYIKCSKHPDSFERQKICAYDEIHKRWVTSTEWSTLNFTNGSPVPVIDLPVDWYNSIPAAKAA